MGKVAAISRRRAGMLGHKLAVQGVQIDSCPLLLSQASSRRLYRKRFAAENAIRAVANFYVSQTAPAAWVESVVR